MTPETSTSPTTATPAPASVRPVGARRVLAQLQNTNSTGPRNSISNASAGGMNCTALKNPSWAKVTANTPKPSSCQRARSSVPQSPRKARRAGTRRIRAAPTMRTVVTAPEDQPLSINELANIPLSANVAELASAMASPLLRRTGMESPGGTRSAVSPRGAAHGNDQNDVRS
nr:hypothetical protein [Microlunatus sp. Gsoil 973]